MRELQNVIERTVILSPRGRFELGDSWRRRPAGARSRRRGVSRTSSASTSLAVLEETGWRVSGERGAANILGLKRTTLEARMKKLGIVRHP